MLGYIHHIEWCVSDLEKVEAKLVNMYGFKVVGQRQLMEDDEDNNVNGVGSPNPQEGQEGGLFQGQRKSPKILVKQRMLRSGETVFVLTENQCETESQAEELRKHYDCKDGNDDDNSRRRRQYPFLTCCRTRSEHHRDTVFNVCLQVDNVVQVVENVVKQTSLSSPQLKAKFAGLTGHPRPPPPPPPPTPTCPPLSGDKEADESLSTLVILNPSAPIKGDNGCMFQYAAIRSCCGNVIHSIVSWEDEDKEGGSLSCSSSSRSLLREASLFLPGFQRVSSTPSSNGVASGDDEQHHQVLTTHMDHVTYVCNTGETRSILDWYGRCFGMKRFLISSMETLEEDGIEIGEEVGMRMTVGEWISSWMCREDGVHFVNSATDSPQNGVHGDDYDDRRNFKLVIAEPLPNRQDSHVQKFMDEHGGPGLQHIGLTVKDDVTKVVKIMADNGAQFRMPPPTYYKLPSKVEEIKAAGADLEQFKNLGILLDSEADYCSSDIETAGKEGHECKKEKFLMQIFTKPLFKEETFFLEVLERRGARGFGAGNITALAKSIILFQNEMVAQG